MKLTQLTKSFKLFAYRLKGFYDSFVTLYIAAPSLRMRAFYGYGHWKFAIKYAHLRNEADGKRYYIIPLGDETLVVANRIEIQKAKDKGWVKKSINCNDLYQYAYYMTPINNKTEK